MGDRALITFKSGSDYSPVIYLHWNGSQAEEWLKQAGPKLRKGDPGYAAARFCGFCHEQLSDTSLGLGLLDSPNDADQADWDNFSHGDAGVLIVDVNTGEVEAHSGYAKGGFTIELYNG